MLISITVQLNKARYMKQTSNIFIFIGIVFSTYATADIKVDKDAGECSAYILAHKNDATLREVNQALEMAENQERAKKYSLGWVEKLVESEGNSMKNLIKAAHKSCERIGVTVSDEQEL